MNDRLQKIKEKFKGSPFAQDVDDFLVQIKEKAEAEAAKSANGSLAQKMVEDVSKVLAEVKALMERRDQGFRDITAYLQFQKEEIEKAGAAQKGVLYDVIEGLSQLTKSLRSTQKVSVTNPASLKLTKADVKAAFTDVITTIEKIVIQQNQEPDKTEYEWTNNRLTKIIEFYNGYELVYTINYNRSGKIISDTVERR